MQEEMFFYLTILSCKMMEDAAAGCQDVQGIRFYIRRQLHIFPVQSLNEVRQVAAGSIGACGFRKDVGDKIVLQLPFIGSVQIHSFGEMRIVGIGKGIGGVMDQFSQSIVIRDRIAVFSLQPTGQSPHIPQRIGIIVSPKPLAPEGAFQIGGRIFVRLDTSQQKGPDVAFRLLSKIFRCQMIGNHAVAFSSHNVLLFLVLKKDNMKCIGKC